MEGRSPEPLPPGTPRWRRGLSWTGLGLGLAALLLALAHGLALAHEWLYFPWDAIEALFREGPLRGPYGPRLLRQTAGFFVELTVVWGVVAVLLRRRNLPWRRAGLGAALHLVPLGLAPLLLFTDQPQVRLLLFAALIGATAGFLAFRVLPVGEVPAASRWPRRLAVALTVAAAGYYVGLAWMQHASYWSSLYDLGLFAGSLRSTVYGDGILFSPQFGCTFLAEHFSPILLLLAPVYRLHPDPMTLQTVMALSMAGAGLLIYFLAEDVLGDGWAALAFCVSYLLAPDVFQAQWHGFKMDLLEPPLIVGAVLALRRESVRWFLLCVALLWSAKEDAVLLTAVLGLYAGVAHRRWVLAGLVILASVVLGLVLIGYVVPAYRMFQEPGLFYRDFPADHYKFSRHFAHLGPTLPKALWGAATNPLYVVGYLFSEARLGGVLTLLAPLGFFALFGGWRAAVLLLPALEMLLASFDFMYSLDFYYSCAPVAFAYSAAVLGLGALVARVRRPDTPQAHEFARRTRVAAFAWLIAAALILAWADVDSPLSPANERPAYLVTPRTRLLDRAVETIPPDVRMSATGYAAIHLMNRPRPAQVPFQLDAAEYVLLDQYRPAFPVKLPAQLAFTRRLLRDPDWGALIAERGVVLLRRGAPRDLNEAGLRRLDEPDLEAEDFETSHFSNLAVRDDDASNGAFLQVTPEDRRGPGLLLFGPMYPLTPGVYEATYRLAASREPYEKSSQPVASIDVFAQGETLAFRDLRFADFPPDGTWADITLRFTVTRDMMPLEFRTYYHDAGTLALDVVRIRRVP